MVTLKRVEREDLRLGRDWIRAPDEGQALGGKGSFTGTGGEEEPTAGGLGWREVVEIFL